MKKVKIEFDFSKWGQEGISVQKDQCEVIQLHKHKIEGRVYGLVKVGFSFNIFECNEDKVIIYQEIKPREIWVNEQESAGFHYSKVFSSKAEAESQKLPFVIRTVKFREVFDDEQ